MRETLKAAIAGLTALASAFGLNGIARAQGLDEILDCRAIAQDMERLHCFDKTTGEAAKRIASDAVRADDTGQTVAKADIGSAQSVDDAPSRENAFGAEDLPKERSESNRGKKEAKTLRAKLVSLHFTRSGRYVITLDNGQVWRQIGGDTDQLLLPSVSENGVPVIIKKKMFGSHTLRPASSKRSIRVERIK